MRPIYQQIANTLLAIRNCERTGNAEWREKHGERLERLIRDSAPSGSGIDCGVKLLDDSTPERLRFSCDFHHMDEGGGYDGWTEHVATVTPSLVFGIEIKISGRDRNGIKEYLAETLDQWLRDDTDPPTECASCGSRMPRVPCPE